VDKPWATLSINSAISALSIKLLPALIKKINEWNKLRPAEAEPIIFSYNLTLTVDDPVCFGPEIFDKDFESALSLLDTDSAMQIGIYEALESIAKMINKAPRDLTKINKLKIYLDQLDARRKTDWRKTFPWLDQSFE